MTYNVKIDVFDGPFDLLLHLVRVHEMDIYDISISGITRQYLEYIQQMQEMDLEVAGDFLVMAATLIQIKSRTLMPLTPEEEAEEDEEEIDGELADIHDAQDLMRRLIEYREFKELAVKLSDREEEQLRLFYRNTVLPRIEDEKDAEDEIREDINLLFSAFARVLQFADGQPTHHIQEEEYHVEDKIEYLDKQIEEHRRVDVSSLIDRCTNKQELLTLFLAMLEICKMRRARVWQSKNYDTIYLVRPSEAENDEEE